jgi:hypothetical protein
MVTEYQLTIDCADPSRQVAFWAEALGYVPKPPPEPFATWREFYLSINVPEDELGEGDCADRLVDPSGRGPGIWFQPVPEGKVVKNRLHLDLFVGGGRAVPTATRRERVDAKVAELVAAGATAVHSAYTPEIDHYFVLMNDPEGNEFCVV